MQLVVLATEKKTSQVLKESGPPHMKSFLTRVTVGEFSAEGEGNSKKLSKKRAALSILQDLKKLPFIPAVEKPKTHYKKRTKTILKVQHASIATAPWRALSEPPALVPLSFLK